jgi:hypothetical protein
MKRQEVGRVSMRAHMILLSDRGYSAPKIAELHNVTNPMVYKWMGRFDEEGPSGQTDTSVTTVIVRDAHRRLTRMQKPKSRSFSKGTLPNMGKTPPDGRRLESRSTYGKRKESPFTRTRSAMP